VEDKIYFDIREAAYFVRDCEYYILGVRKLIEFVQTISDVMRYDENGNKKPDGKNLNFLAFWKSDVQYLPENIKKNMDGCRLVNENLELSSVNPSNGCGDVIRSYMGLGALIKFDQKIFGAMQSLNYELSNIYQEMISGKSTKTIRKLEESQQE
jgi:hypothetical protein